MILFLPFTVPDEPVHYFSAYKMSNYFLLKFSQFKQDSIIIRQSDKLFYEKIASTALNAQQYFKIKEQFSVFSNQNQLVDFSFPIASNVPLGYLISGFFIAIARILNFSPFLTFYFGRMANIVLYAVLTYFAMKRIPYGKMMIFGISVLPMTLHLIASYSYDFIAISFSILYISQVLYIKEKDGCASKKDIFICALYAIVLAPSKLVYVPVLLFAFIIPNEKLNCINRKALVIKAVIVFSGLLFLVIMQSKSLFVIASSAEKNNTGWSGIPNYSLSWVISNPVSAMKIILSTIFEKGEFYFTTLLGGSLGWFQFYLPNYCYVPFSFILFCCFLKVEDEPGTISFYNKLFTAFIILLSAFLVLLSMFVTWTPNNSRVIEGVQGRYFLPLLPLLYIVLRNKFIVIKKNSYLYTTIFTMYFSLFFATQCFLYAFN